MTNFEEDITQTINITKKSLVDNRVRVDLKIGQVTGSVQLRDGDEIIRERDFSAILPPAKLEEFKTWLRSQW